MNPTVLSEAQREAQDARTPQTSWRSFLSNIPHCLPGKCKTTVFTQMLSHLIGGKPACPSPPLACSSWGRMSVPSPLELGLNALAEDHDPRGVFWYLGGSRSNGAGSAAG